MTDETTFENAEPGPDDDFERFLIEGVTLFPDTITIRYGGRSFGGVVREWLGDSRVETAIRPGAELLVYYHRTAAGGRGPIAMMLVRRPERDDWAEIYVDADTVPPDARAE